MGRFQISLEKTTKLDKKLGWVSKSYANPKTTKLDEISTSPSWFVGWVLNLKVRFPNLIKKTPYNLPNQSWVGSKISIKMTKLNLTQKLGWNLQVSLVIKAFIITEI